MEIMSPDFFADKTANHACMFRTSRPRGEEGTWKTRQAKVVPILAHLMQFLSNAVLRWAIGSNFWEARRSGQKAKVPMGLLFHAHRSLGGH
jgi:hypothetical protein